MALQIDDDGNIYDDGVNDGNSGNDIVYDNMPVKKDYDFWESIGINPDTTMENWKSPSNAEIEEAIKGDATFSGLLRQYGKSALDLLKTNGAYDPKKLAMLGAGLAAANKPNNVAPTGYQGKIPKLTATSNMLTAPPVGRRPGSGGINYGGGVTYRDEKGNSIAPNEKTIAELQQAAESNPFNRPSTYETPTAGGGANMGLAAGGLARDGFVLPADVVSHFGNGSSEAGLKLLASKLGATPIKGEGDGMSDSIKTKIDGVQEARVANDEAYVSPEKVKELGNGNPEKGARKLYAMMDEIRKARTGSTKQGKEIDPGKYMPGGSVQRYDVGGTTTRTVPTGATGSESSLSNWVGDYVTNMLGQGQALANSPYQAYTGPLTAGSSNLQNQAFQGFSNLQTPGSINDAASTAGTIARQAQNMPAYQAGNFGNQFQAPQAYEAGKFATGEFDEAASKKYMNPYLQSALNPAMEEARRQAGIGRMQDAGRLAQSGAFGGSRQAIMEAEGSRNLMDKQNQMLTQGYSTAFDKAMQGFQSDQARKLQADQMGEQSRQFGAGQGLTSAQLAAQYGLAGQQLGEQSRQFGANQGLQGLQTALQAANAQGNLGSLQNQSNLANLRSMMDAGGIQRGIESEGIAADKAQFEEARLNPFKMLQFQQSLLSGLPLASQSYSMPGTNNLTQFAQGATGLQQLLDILSGKTTAAKKP